MKNIVKECYDGLDFAIRNSGLDESANIAFRKAVEAILSEPGCDIINNRYKMRKMIIAFNTITELTSAVNVIEDLNEVEVVMKTLECMEKNDVFK